MRLVSKCVIVLSVLVSSAPASPINGGDPHIMYATGGDAIPLMNGVISITLSQANGGIFVFQNETKSDLTKLDVNVQFPIPSFDDIKGFGITDTVTPTQTSFSFGLFSHATCADVNGFSATTSCLAMEFGVVIPQGQDFILDFDFPFTRVDTLVQSGQYNPDNCKNLDLGCTGMTDTGPNRVGDWTGPFTGPLSAGVSPASIPEPGTFGMLILGGAGLLACYRRRKNSAR